jgi:lysophospholipase L1-like esterase
VARRSGACVVVPPGRGRLPLDVFRGVRATERRAARRGGCAYAPVLDVLGSRRYFTLDGVHPDALGYRVVARRLAPVIAAAAR